MQPPKRGGSHSPHLRPILTSATEVCSPIVNPHHLPKRRTPTGGQVVPRTRAASSYPSSHARVRKTSGERGINRLLRQPLCTGGDSRPGGGAQPGGGPSAGFYTRVGSSRAGGKPSAGGYTRVNRSRAGSGDRGGAHQPNQVRRDLSLYEEVPTSESGSPIGKLVAAPQTIVP